MGDAFATTFADSFAIAENLLSRFRNDETSQNQLADVGRLVQRVFERGGKVLIGGNGGSMADAMHFAEEWTGRFRRDRLPFPVLVLGADSAHLSCVANDFGFDQVFARSITAFGKEDDIAILLSTSGNSENLIQAAHAARDVPMPVIGLLGKGGGRLAPMCDVAIVAPGDTSDRIQELHMLSLHILIEAVEVEMGVA